MHELTQNKYDYAFNNDINMQNLAIINNQRNPLWWGLVS